jgi:hypothetical protein
MDNELLKIDRGSMKRKMGYPIVEPRRVPIAIAKPKEGQRLHHTVFRNPIEANVSTRSPGGQTYRQNHLGRHSAMAAEIKPATALMLKVLCAILEQSATKGLAFKMNPDASFQNAHGHSRTTADAKHAS